MRSIKTYEGFLDFFKRKPKIDKSAPPVYMDDIIECGYDLLHDGRVSAFAHGEVPGGIGPSLDEIFGAKRRISHDQEDATKFRNVRGNIMIIQFRYRVDTGQRLAGSRNVSAEEMTELLKDFVGKLESMECTASFFLSWGWDEGRTDDREYKTVEKAMSVIAKTKRDPLVTMKIVAPSNIIVD
jgi:hypothetical protein